MVVVEYVNRRTTCTHVTELLRELHRFPVIQRITYKVAAIIHIVREIVSNL
jgi:hypothetical protein